MDSMTIIRVKVQITMTGTKVQKTNVCIIVVVEVDRLWGPAVGRLVVLRVATKTTTGAKVQMTIIELGPPSK